jgi:hypothetical protein
MSLASKPSALLFRYSTAIALSGLVTVLGYQVTPPKTLALLIKYDSTSSSFVQTFRQCRQYAKIPADIVSFTKLLVINYSWIPSVH